MALAWTFAGCCGVFQVMSARAAACKQLAASAGQSAFTSSIEDFLYLALREVMSGNLANQIVFSDWSA